MRSADAVRDNEISPQTLLDDSSQPSIGAAQASLGLQSLRDYLPPWLGGKDARTRSLSWMLQALNTAAESYLETSLSTVEVVVPFPASDSYLDALRSACSSLSLRMPMSAQPPAGILAARAHGIRGKCTIGPVDDTSEQKQRDDLEQIILTVDYNRAALTALLIVEECGIFEYRRVLHNASIGTDGLSRGSKNGRDDLARALRQVTRLPLEDRNGAGLKQISQLVLLGESADNQQLEDALKGILGEQSGTLLSTASHERARKVSPLFAASRGVAQDCWGRQPGGCLL